MEGKRHNGFLIGTLSLGPNTRSPNGLLSPPLFPEFPLAWMGSRGIEVSPSLARLRRKRFGVHLEAPHQ